MREKDEGHTGQWEVQVALLFLIHFLSMDGKRNWSKAESDLRVLGEEQKAITDHGLGLGLWFSNASAWQNHLGAF